MVILQTKQYRRNLIKGLNTWAVSLVRYLGLGKEEGTGLAGIENSVVASIQQQEHYIEIKKED